MYIYIVSSLIVLSLMYKCKYDIYLIIISSIYKGSLFIKILKRIFIFCKLESYRIHNTIYQICVFISSNDIGKRRWGIELKSIWRGFRYQHQCTMGLEMFCKISEKYRVRYKATRDFVRYTRRYKYFRTFSLYFYPSMHNFIRFE